MCSKVWLHRRSLLATGFLTLFLFIQLFQLKKAVLYNTKPLKKKKKKKRKKITRCYLRNAQVAIPRLPRLGDAPAVVGAGAGLDAGDILLQLWHWPDCCIWWEMVGIVPLRPKFSFLTTAISMTYFVVLLLKLCGRTMNAGHCKHAL